MILWLVKGSGKSAWCPRGLVRADPICLMSWSGGHAATTTRHRPRQRYSRFVEPRASEGCGWNIRGYHLMGRKIALCRRRSCSQSPISKSMLTMRVHARWLVILLTALCVPSVVLAHAGLRSSVPADNSHLSVVPRELRLTFTEASELSFTRVELFGPDSQVVALEPIGYGDGDARRVVVAAIRGTLREGTYTVLWQVVGADGHPVRGRYSFMIMPGASGLADLVAPLSSGEAGAGVMAPGQTPPPAAHHQLTLAADEAHFGAESAPYIAIRWWTFTALLVAIGAVAFHLVVLGSLRRMREPASPLLLTLSSRTAALGLWAVAALALAAPLRLYAQSFALHGAGRALDPTLIATMLGRTVWGWGWILQLVGVAVAFAGLLIARRGRGSGWTIATIGVIALAFTPALSGHAAAVPRLTSLAVLADGLHVIGAAGWLGSLLFVVAVGIPATRQLPKGARGQGVADLVNAFSPTALAFATIAAVTGVFSAWLHLDAVSALWQSEYGRTLLLKLGVLSIVAATAAYNWLRVRPALGSVEGSINIHRSATLELVVGVLVVVVTALLVATPTPVGRTVAEAFVEPEPYGVEAEVAPLADSLAALREP